MVFALSVLRDEKAKLKTLRNKLRSGIAVPGIDTPEEVTEHLKQINEFIIEVDDAMLVLSENLVRRRKK